MNRKGINNPFYGKHHSKETKERLSELRKGCIGAFLGKKHSEETKKKISENHKGFMGRTHSEETKKKIKERLIPYQFKCGHIPWTKGKKLPEVSERLRNNKFMLGYKHTEETKQKMSKAKLGKKFTEEHKKNMSIAKKGRIFSLEHKRKLSESLQRRMKNEIFKKKILEAIKKYWLNPESKEKLIKRNYILLHSEPNKTETKLNDILNDLQPNEWKYVGNGQIIINGKCPDFININGKKLIIELFGNYWHKGQNPQDRMDCFSPFGYKSLIIWENELKELNSLKIKINNFIRG